MKDHLGADATLLRLNFETEDYSEGELIPTAISLEDLISRGYSLDAEGLLEHAVLSARAVKHASRAPEKRISPFVSPFLCGSVSSLKEEGEPVFKLELSPTSENKAHVSLYSAQTPSGKTHYRRLRGMLVKILNRHIPLSDYFANKI